MKIKVSDYIIQFLVSKGVKDVFTVPGGGCIHLIDSLGKNKNINYICNLHEQGSAIAAEAYSQYTGNLGVAIVTTGPGGTNAITGVASAWLDSIPMMIISGQVQQKDMVNGSGVRQKGFQELNLPKLVESITKYAVTITNPNSVQHIFEYAYKMAKTGRQGPVWIEVPLDIQNSIMDYDENFICSSFSKYKDYSEEIKNIIKDFNNSKKPVLLLGNGLKKHTKIIPKLIRTLKIPVLTTWKAADFIGEENVFYIGRPGIIGNRAANFIQQKSDFIMCLGARLDCGQTAFNINNFAPNAKKIIVDIDKFELEKIYCDYSICSDTGFFVKELLRNKFKDNHHYHRLWLLESQMMKKKYSLEKEAKYIPIYNFIHTLSDLMEKNDILIPGSSGLAAEVTLQAFKVKRGQRIINSPGLGSMGFGIPAAIGACIASERKNTICVEGDGSFMMNVQELEIIKRLNLPIKIFVLNNNGYESIRKTQDKFFNGKYIASDKDGGLTLPSIEKISDCYDLDYYFDLNDVGYKNLNNTIKLTLKYSKPFIHEICLPMNNKIICKTISYQKEDGTFASKPMENLYPSLPELDKLINN